MPASPCKSPRPTCASRPLLPAVDPRPTAPSQTCPARATRHRARCPFAGETGFHSTESPLLAIGFSTPHLYIQRAVPISYNSGKIGNDLASFHSFHRDRLPLSIWKGHIICQVYHTFIWQLGSACNAHCGRFGHFKENKLGSTTAIKSAKVGAT